MDLSTYTRIATNYACNSFEEAKNILNPNALSKIYESYKRNYPDDFLKEFESDKIIIFTNFRLPPATKIKVLTKGCKEVDYVSRVSILVNNEYKTDFVVNENFNQQ
jgi:hypothetical protein